MPYTYPGQAFQHTVKPLKGWYEDSGIDAAGKLSTNVNIGGTNLPAVRGLIVHGSSLQSDVDPYGGTMTGPQVFFFEMGCGPAHGIPMILWTPPTDPDVYNPGVPVGVPAYGQAGNIAEFGSSLPRIDGGNLVALVFTGAYELETTEYDTAQTYATGQPLRSVTSNTDANAGKITNQRGPVTNGFTSTGLVQFVGNTATVANWDTIIGFVSRGAYTNSNRQTGLALYTEYLAGNR
jgi:hypothetical protein